VSEHAKWGGKRDDHTLGSRGTYWRGVTRGMTIPATARRPILVQSRTPSDASAGKSVKVSSGQMSRYAYTEKETSRSNER